MTNKTNEEMKAMVKQIVIPELKEGYQYTFTTYNTVGEHSKTREAFVVISTNASKMVDVRMILDGVVESMISDGVSCSAIKVETRPAMTGVGDDHKMLFVKYDVEFFNEFAHITIPKISISSEDAYDMGSVITSIHNILKDNKLA